MFKTEWLQSLAQVIELGSFSAVAIKRGVTAMAISKQISSLEDQVGESLLNRSTKKVSPTEAGNLLLEKCQTLLHEHNVLSDWLIERHQEPSGVLKVLGVEEKMMNLTITPWVGEFLAAYPKIKLDVTLISDVTELQNYQADIYWGFGDYLGQLMPGLKRKLLVETDFGIYASRDYLRKYGNPEQPEDLKNHYIIGNAHNNPSNALFVKGGKAFENDLLSGEYLHTQVVTTFSVFKLAEQGLGIINSSERLFNANYKGVEPKLIPILEAHWLSISVYAYFHQVRLEQPKVRAFLDFFFSKRTEWTQEI